MKDFVKRGFRCDFCDKTISYPNRFIRKYLSIIKEQVEGIDYEKRFVWSKKFIYDGYFRFKNRDYIIEMQGEQHYRDTQWSSYEKIHENDLKKKELAIKNKCEYIEIDCKQSDFQYIKTNIQKSILGKLFILTNTQWKELEEFLYENIMMLIKEKYEQGKTITEIAQEFKIDRHTVTKYLRKLAKINLINYNPIASKPRPIIVKNMKKEIIYQGASIKETSIYMTKNYYPMSVVPITTYADTNKPYHGYYFYFADSDSNFQKDT